MRFAVTSFCLALTAIFCFAQELNFDELLFNPENPEDLLFDGAVPGAADELYMIEDEFQTVDTNLIADIADDCAFISSPASRIRARADSCPGQSQAPFLDVQTDDDVKKYWCSESKFVGFGNIPVCKNHIYGENPGGVTMDPTIDGVRFETPGFRYLPFCTPSMFIPFLHRPISSASHRIQWYRGV
jgi:hypothetical protein